MASAAPASERGRHLQRKSIPRLVWSINTMIRRWSRWFIFGVHLLYVTRKLSHPGSWQIINLYEFYIDPRNYFCKYPKPNTNLSILCDWNFGFQNRYWNFEPTCGGNGSVAAFGKHSHTVMLEHQTLRLQDDGKCFRKNLVQWARENSNVIQM